MREMREGCIILNEKPQGKGHLGSLAIDGSIILKRILKK
jgi:hypothetical protein